MAILAFGRIYRPTNTALDQRLHDFDAIERKAQEYRDTHPDYVPPADPFLATSSESTPSEPEPEMKELVLVDQDFTNVGNAHGRAWMRAISVKKLHGMIGSGSTLEVTVTRGSSTGFTGVGLYVAKMDRLGYPDESVYGTHLHYLDASWTGKCSRHLDPSDSFGLLHEDKNTTVTGLYYVPVTRGDDGCETGKEPLNLLTLIHDGSFLGFLPGDPTAHLKVTLRYTGDVTVTPF